MKFARENLSGEIHVTEDENHFKVKIHPSDREIVKVIQGRRWDVNEKKWIFKKNKQSFFDLKENLQNISTTFAIQEPTETGQTDFSVKEEEEDINTEVTETEIPVRKDPVWEAFLENQSKRSLEINYFFNTLVDWDKEERVEFEEDRTKEINRNVWTIIIYQFVNEFPLDKFTEILKSNSFSLDNYRTSVRDIQLYIKELLLEFIPEEEYKKKLEEVNQKNKKNKHYNKQSLRKSSLTLSETIKLASYFIDSSNTISPTRMLESANHLRNKLEHERMHNKIEKFAVINYIFLTRMACSLLNFPLVDEE